MKLYLVRHGQTEWNKDTRIQGQIDIPLDETGRLQAHELGVLLKTTVFDLIYSSPLKRAKETAEILNGYLQSRIILEASLREASYGSAEGMKREEYRLKYANELARIHNLPFHKRMTSKVIPDGESTEEVATRALCFLKNLVSEGKEKKLLIVCHGGVIRSVLVSLFKLNDRRISIQNTGYAVLEYYKGNFLLGETHKFDEESPLSQRFVF